MAKNSAARKKYFTELISVAVKKSSNDLKEYLRDWVSIVSLRDLGSDPGEREEAGSVMKQINSVLKGLKVTTIASIDDLPQHAAELPDTKTVKQLWS